MHLGVLSTSYPRTPTDPAGNFVAGLCDHLHRAGHRLTVVCAGEPGDGPSLPGAADPRDRGLVVHRVPSGLFYHGGAPDALAAAPLRAGLGGAAFSLRLLLAARRHLRGCDAILSHWAVPCGVIGAALCAGRPHLCIAHSSDVHLLRRLRAEVVLRRLAARADLVYSAASLVVPGAPGRVVPMGIRCADFAPSGPDPLAAHRAAAAALGLRRPTLLSLGRLVPVKGLAVLLAAMTPDPGLDLLICGDGPEAAALRAQARPLGPRVRFLGEVHGARRRDLLLAAAALVLPSLRLPDGRTEGSPTVVLEALAAGCPVVASDVGGVAALLTAPDGPSPQGLAPAGCLVPPGDAGALRAALSRVPDPTWQARSRAAAARLAPQHDWSVVAPRLLGDLDGLLAATGPAQRDAPPAHIADVAYPG